MNDKKDIKNFINKIPVDVLKKIQEIDITEHTTSIESEKKKNELKLIYIGKKLKEYREKANLTQDYVASYLSISRQTIRYYEHGERAFNYMCLQKIKDLFNIEEKDLMDGFDEFYKTNKGDKNENERLKCLKKKK